MPVQRGMFEAMLSDGSIISHPYIISDVQLDMERKGFRFLTNTDRDKVPSMVSNYDGTLCLDWPEGRWDRELKSKGIDLHKGFIGPYQDIEIIDDAYDSFGHIVNEFVAIYVKDVNKEK